MKNLLFVLLCFNAWFGHAQKYCVIENSGENAKYFDYSNPNSFVGILNNNIHVIANLSAENYFVGVYQPYELSEIGLDTATMLKFHVEEPIEIFLPLSEANRLIVKTDQTLDVFLDSLDAFNPESDFEMLGRFSYELLKSSWDAAQVNELVKIRSAYFFDVRDLKAILIGQEDGIDWVHFVKSLPNGQSFVSLSLKKSQLKNIVDFEFWQFLTDEQSLVFKDIYKQNIVELLNSESYKSWKDGVFNGFVLSEIDTTFKSTCRRFNHDFWLVRDSQMHHTFKNEIIKSSETEELIVYQDRGELIEIYRWLSEDYFPILKTNQSIENYIDSLGASNPDSDYAELGQFTYEMLKGCWEETTLHEQLRRPPLTLIVWKDIPNSKVALGYRWENQESLTVFNQAVSFINQNGSLLPIMNFNLDIDNTPLNIHLSSIQIDRMPIDNWFNCLNTDTRKIKLARVQKSLKLINQF